MSAGLFLCFYLLFAAGPLALCSLVAVEVVMALRQGRWCNWFTIGLLTVVSLTVLLLMAFYNVMRDPINLWLPMECCIVFSGWATSFVWWHFMILKETAATRPKPAPPGEMEVAIRRRIGELIARGDIMLVHTGFFDALANDILPGDAQPPEPTKEAPDEQH